MQQLRRDGVTLCSEEAGSGTPVLLLIHPYGGDHAYMGPLARHFRRRHRVVAVDLRGHGQSDRPEQEYTVPGFADDLAWMCRELGVAKPVVVGHSGGGTIALELAARFPDLPAAVVVLDALAVPPAGMLDAFRPYAAGLQTPAYRDVVRRFYSSIVGFPDDPRRRQRILDDMAANPQHVMASAVANILAYDTDAAAAACAVPLLYVSSGPWYTDVARFRERCPQLVTGQAVGSGHFLQLEVPDQVNAMIRRFLTVASLAPTAPASTARRRASAQGAR